MPRPGEFILHYQGSPSIAALGATTLGTKARGIVWKRRILTINFERMGMGYYYGVKGRSLRWLISFAVG